MTQIDSIKKKLIAHYSLLSIIVSIVVTSIIGFRWAINQVELIATKIATDVITPVIKRQDDLEKKQTKLEDSQVEIGKNLIINSNKINNTYICLNNFLYYYNRVYNKEFLVPSQITEESIENERKYK